MSLEEGPKEFADLDHRQASPYAMKMVELLHKMRRADFRCEHADCRARATRIVGPAGDKRALCAAHALDESLNQRVAQQQEERRRVLRRA